MSVKTYFGVFFIALLYLNLVNVAAQDMTEEEIRDLAELNYDEAEYQYSLENCRDAIGYANRSLELYTLLQDSIEILKASNLVNEVTECLRKEGDGYYADALGKYAVADAYFKTKEYDSAKNEFINSESLVLEANISYSLMEPRDSVLLGKALELYTNIQGKFRDIAIIEAEGYYDMARTLWEEEPPKYKQVKKYSGDALEIFIEYNHPDGIYKAQDLLDRVNKDIEEIRIYADSQKELGRTAFDSKEYMKAIDRFILARDAYTLIEMTSDVADCQYYIDLSNIILNGTENELKKEAEGYYEESQRSRIRYDYVNASLNVNKSKAIYKQLLDNAVRNVDYEKQEEYTVRIKECSNLLKEINKEIENQIISKEAEKIYVKAYDRYREGDYENASLFVNTAYEQFTSANNRQGIAKCALLNASLKLKFDLLDLAEEHYNTSISLYENAYYENATFYANKSLAIYMNISRTTGIRKVNALLDDIREGVERKEEADMHYERAITSYNVDDLDNAERETNNAKKIFEEINWAQGVQKCEDLNDEIDEKREQPSIVEWLRKNVPIVIFLMVVAVVIWWNSERNKIRKAEREKIEAEEKRKLEERLAKEKEERERKEARRREIEEERKKSKDVVTETREGLIGIHKPIKEPDESLESEVLKELESDDLEEPDESLESEVLEELKERDSDESLESEVLKELVDSGELEKEEPVEPLDTLEEEPGKLGEDMEADRSLEIAREKYSSGKITREEFLKIKTDLKESPPGDDTGGEMKLEKSAISIEREKAKEKDAMIKEAIKEVREKQTTEPEDNKAIDEEVEAEVSEIMDLFDEDKKKKKKKK